MHLVTCSIYEAAVRSINTIITTLGVCLYNVLEVCQVWLYYSCIAVTQRLMSDVIVPRLCAVRPTFRWRRKLSDTIETIISSGEVFAKYTPRRSLRLGGLGSIVFRCFEIKMLGNATLLLNIFLGIFFVIFGRHLFSTEGSWIFFWKKIILYKI